MQFTHIIRVKIFEVSLFNKMFLCSVFFVINSFNSNYYFLIIIRGTNCKNYSNKLRVFFGTHNYISVCTTVINIFFVLHLTDEELNMLDFSCYTIMLFAIVSYLSIYNSNATPFESDYKFIYNIY